MGRVILGAVVGAILGGILGWWPNYAAATFTFPLQVQGQTVTQTISLAKVISCISILVGFAAGGIAGAIAGATSARPNSLPVPGWVWVTVLVICLLLTALVLVVAVLYNARSSPVNPSEPIPREDAVPAQKEEPQRNNPQRPPEKGAP